MNLLEELSELYPPQETQANFISMLKSLSACMTDRASNMKSFAKELEKERQSLLQTEEELQFLHCNAHFLLGLATEAKKALADLEKEGGERLGRDRPSSAASRKSQKPQLSGTISITISHSQFKLDFF